MKKSLFYLGSLIIVIPLSVLGCQAQKAANSSSVAQNTSSIQLPSWFLLNRVQMHSDGSVSSLGNTTDYGAIIQSLGGTVWTRHVKLSKTGDPSWPSAVPIGTDGKSILGGSPNLLKPIIDNVHAHGIKFIAYYFYQTDQTIERLHPEWACKTVQGTPAAYKLKKGFNASYLDITSGYREIVLQRLLELAQMGADGYYFDEEHMPYEGCFGSVVYKNFMSEIGKNTRITSSQDSDINFQKFAQYQAKMDTSSIQYWEKEVKKKYPNVVFIVSNTTLPSLSNPHSSSQLASISDSPKSEFDLAIRSGRSRVFLMNPDLAIPDNDIRMAFGWSLLRDAAQGRPPHIWSPQFYSANAALTVVYSLVAYGAIANLHISQSLLLQPGQLESYKEWYKTANTFGRQIAPYMTQPPLEWAAVHYAEQARNRRASERAAWQQVLWPEVGAFTGFSREGLPVRIVTDDELQAIDRSNYKVLFLSNPKELTTAQQVAVDKFKQRGGIIINNDESWNWSIPQSSASTITAFRQKLKAIATKAPVALDNVSKSSRIHVIPYANPVNHNWLIAIVNDFSAVHAETQNINLKETQGKSLRRRKNSRSSQAKLLINSSNTASVFPSPTPNMTIIIRPTEKPKRAFNLLTGEEVPMKTIGNSISLNVGPLANAAYIVVEF